MSYGYGIHVYTGFIVGLLFALPTTQLAARLAREGRLGEQFEVLPAPDSISGSSPRHQVLADYRDILLSVYAAPAFFGRWPGWPANSTCARLSPRF